MLTFNVKKEWFEKIKSGEKTHEYREVKPYWTKRLAKQNQWDKLIDRKGQKIALFDITFCCGYPAKKDKEKRISAICLSKHIINGKNTNLKIDKPVYDIEFKVIK